MRIKNIKRKKASDNKMATLDEANDNFDNLDVGNNDFEYKEHKRNTDRTTIKIDLFASEAVRFGVLTVLRL